MKVAVLLGGDSPEREVSLASGRGIINALREKGHEAWPVDPALPVDAQGEPEETGIGEMPPESIPVLSPERAFEWLSAPLILDSDLVFMGLHGGAGEDGTVQALLEVAGVPYTGTGILGSALAMNKDRSKALFNEAGVQTARHIYIRDAEKLSEDRLREMIERDLEFPVVLKPNCQGSSVGFSFVPDPSKLGGALERAVTYGGGIIAERYVNGREITATVLDGEALPLVEIIPEGGFYDYKRKYTKGQSRYVVPAEVDEKLAGRIKREAVSAYGAIWCRDYARVDFRVSDAGEPYCLEVNTLPGMTELSLVPMSAGEAGLSFAELVERICMMAYNRGKRL